MENKKSTLATVLLLIAVLVIGTMAGYIYMQKIKTDKKIAELENEKTQMQGKVDELQGKIDNEKEVKIEGEYNIVDDEYMHGLTYEFVENKVTISVLGYSRGIYEIVDNKVKITYTESYDPEGNPINIETKNEELIIVDENTLMSKKKVDGELYIDVFVKE